MFANPQLAKSQNALTPDVCQASPPPAPAPAPPAGGSAPPAGAPGLPAARIGDMHTCPLVNPGPVPHVGGPILTGFPTVIIGFMPAARVTDMVVCVGPPDMITKGSPTVFIGYLPAARLGDMTAHGGVIVMGFPTVLIGDSGSGGAGAAGPASPANVNVQVGPQTDLVPPEQPGSGSDGAPDPKAVEQKPPPESVLVDAAGAFGEGADGGRALVPDMCAPGTPRAPIPIPYPIIVNNGPLFGYPGNVTSYPTTGNSNVRDPGAWGAGEPGALGVPLAIPIPAGVGGAPVPSPGRVVVVAP